MKIFTVSQIKELDQYTIRHEPVSSIDLMERASVQFVNALLGDITQDKRIVVFAGPGNNGGDALAVSRLLLQKGYKVVAYLLNITGKLSPDCELNRTQLSNLPGGRIVEIENELPLIDLQTNDIVIDGLFGSGLSRPLYGLSVDIVKLINESGLKVYSIDIPSGLFGESNETNILENIVCATKTFTFQNPKLAFFMPENEYYTGEWEILDIGLHPDVIKESNTSFFYLQKCDITKILHTRNKFAYKNNFGHALIVAGSKGKMGAAVLSAKSTLKSGAGLVTSHIPGRGEFVLQSALPEVMVELDADNDKITHLNHSDSFTSIGIGPGIGMDKSTVEALERLLREWKVPMVLDADALNIITQNKHLLKLIFYKILTPHVGEFERLTEKVSSSYIRLENARNFAAENNCIVVLKGAYTAICSPDKKVYFNSTGNPGMATAGSGDVLTGIITGLLSQSYSPLEATKLGVYIHGLAGDIAVRDIGEESLVAGNIIDYLGKAFMEIRKVL